MESNVLFFDSIDEYEEKNALFSEIIDMIDNVLDEYCPIDIRFYEIFLSQLGISFPRKFHEARMRFLNYDFDQCLSFYTWDKDYVEWDEKMISYGSVSEYGISYYEYQLYATEFLNICQKYIHIINKFYRRDFVRFINFGILDLYQEAVLLRFKWEFECDEYKEYLRIGDEFGELGLLRISREEVEEYEDSEDEEYSTDEDSEDDNVDNIVFDNIYDQFLYENEDEIEVSLCGHLAPCA